MPTPGPRLVSALAALPLALVACGDDGGSSADDVVDIDAAAVDAPPPSPDAEPGPDAPAGAFDCIGTALPITAGDPLAIAGITQAISLSGQTPVGDIAVSAHDGADAELDATTSAASGGAYALSVATAGAPVDGYVLGRAATYLDTYVYPPTPLATDQASVPVLMITPGNFALLANLADTPQQDTSGWIGLVVVDCNGDPIPGATVTSSAGGVVRYTSPQGIPDTAATSTSTNGLAMIFDVPAGDTSVDAMAGGHSLLEHTLEVRANAITTTIVAPGPVN